MARARQGSPGRWCGRVVERIETNPLRKHKCHLCFRAARSVSKPRRAGAAPMPGRNVMLESTSGTCGRVGGSDAGQVARPGASMPGRLGIEATSRAGAAPMPGRNVLESTSGTCVFEVPRNWKQAPTIFWLLPAWSSAADCAARRHTTREINKSASVSQLR